MKSHNYKLCYLFVLFFCFSIKIIHAQRSPQEAESLRFKAQTNRDTIALQNLLHDDLSYCHSNGLIENKQDFIKSVNSGKIIYESITMIEHSIRKKQKSAIITGICTVKGSIKTTPFDIRLRYLSVYFKSGGKWKLAAWQSLKL
jgi:hypothetical protein